MKKLNIHNVDLMISAVSKKQYPKHNKPEVAMCGRSNVGKSTFINTILERKNYVQVGLYERENLPELFQKFICKPHQCILILTVPNSVSIHESSIS